MSAKETSHQKYIIFTFCQKNFNVNMIAGKIQKFNLPIPHLDFENYIR